MFRQIVVQIDELETAVAVMEDDKLVEFYLERFTQERLAGNIYKGKVENVLPGMQAAFVNVGLERNTFLYIEDAFPPGRSQGKRNGGKKVNDVLRRGQEILVQVTKESSGNKGARVTTNICLPGRNFVFLPTASYIGISRRLKQGPERQRLKKLSQEILPPGTGLIVRTAAREAEKKELQEELQDLIKLWEHIKELFEKSSSPCLLHQDVTLIDRVTRDLLVQDVDRLLINSRDEYNKLLHFLTGKEGLKKKIKYMDAVDLFSICGVSSQIEQATKRKVWLKCGGYLVIDQAEALTVVDVNTGKYVGRNTLYETILQTNLEAAVEIARQLRLRNIGGIIIVDFIDMDHQEHQELVLQVLEKELKKDRTRTNLLGLTRLGLVEITRKKIRRGLESVLLKECSFCGGAGKILSEQSVSLKARKDLLALAEKTSAPAIYVETHPSVAAMLIGSGGSSLVKLETSTKKQIFIKGVDTFHPEEVKITPTASTDDIRQIAIPVKEGEVLEVKVEKPHTVHNSDGIARVEGFVLQIANGANKVGKKVKVEITEVYRTFAKARLSR